VSGPRQIFGVQPVREALRAHGNKVSWIALQRESERLDGLRRLAESQGVPIREVSRGELDRFSRGEMHQGAAAEAPPLKLHEFSDLVDPERSSLLMVLDGIQDPQNFGALVRSCVGLNRTPVIWGENASAPLSPSTFRASAGAVEHATLCRTPSLIQALQTAAAAGYQIVGLDGHATTSLHECNLVQPTVLVVGSEGEGLGKAVRRQCSAFARVASPATVDSLNASVAAALALYEACRQRGVL
jgi:23S rRNA (guanosine2251-2'-O)-methyltransferase